MRKIITSIAVIFSALSMCTATIDDALTLAGENKAEIEKALENAPTEQKKGMEFLIEHMPEVDLKSLTADFLLENVALAYKARSEFPWAKDVPENIFFNDVLPYAVLDECRDNWRRDFYERFTKHVKAADAKTMGDAISAVNRAIKKEVDVEYNTNREKPHQSPYESMKINMASCTGLSILLVDALRSVGIPSRVAGIPMWTTKRGNHNWVEVWTPFTKSWHFLEYGIDQLDKGWFLADASKANAKSFVHSIYATSWEATDIHFPMVWNMKSKQVNGVNVSDFYIKLGGGDKKRAENICDLRIDYTVDGKRMAIPVVVMQGDVKLGDGVTPKRTDDMNNFYTFPVQKGQMYQIRWLAPDDKKWRTKEVLPTDEDDFKHIKL